VEVAFLLEQVQEVDHPLQRAAAIDPAQKLLAGVLQAPLGESADGIVALPQAGGRGDLVHSFGDQHAGPAGIVVERSVAQGGEGQAVPLQRAVLAFEPSLLDA